MVLPEAEQANEHLESARVTAAQADILVAETARASEAMRFSPILRYSPYRRISAEEIERYTSGVEALVSGLTHARTASRAAWHATHTPRRMPAPIGDWQGLCTVLEPAIERFERYVLDGKFATSAGVTAGIDLALELARRLGGDDAAREIQLQIEYDPTPPLRAGSPEQAPPELVSRLQSRARRYR